MASEIVSTIVAAIGSFVSGLGEAFLTAFQTIFMVATESNGVITYSGINSLGIFVLVFMGVSFGYGVIRFITSLFRRKGQ